MYELQWMLERLLKRAAGVWDAFRSRLPTLPGRWLLLLSLGVLAIYAFLLRCLHLLDRDYYYMVSPDSYFFHWVARGVMAGEPPPYPPGAETTYILHSGLSYPMAYIAKAISYVFNLSSVDSLDLVCKLLPLLLAVISMLVIFLAASKIWGRRVGLLSAFAWAAMSHVVFVGLAGNVDRDGLSILLLMSGAFLFYLSRGWHFYIGNRDVGWIAAGLGVLAIEGILYLEWSFVGSIFLLTILAVYFVVKVLLGYTDRLTTEHSPLRRLTAAANEINWQTFALIILGNIIVAGIALGLNPQLAASWFDIIMEIFREEGQSSISELRGLSLNNLLAFAFFLVPIAVGLYVAWRRREEGSIFVSCWFLCLLALSLFASRVLLYALPAACILSGLGLAFLWSWKGRFQTLKKLGVVALLCLTMLYSLTAAYNMASGAGGLMAPDRDWQDALTYLRESTPQDAVIMTQWSTGYWILDLGQRRPVVDNGYYHQDPERLHDIGTAYTTAEPAVAVEIMNKYGATYLVFSTIELVIEDAILRWAELDEVYNEFPPDSMIVRSLEGRFESEDGLRVMYRSAPDSEVVILGLTQTKQS